MKEISFFKTKSEQLKSEVELIDVDNSNYFENNINYKNQKEKLEDLLFQTKLMFHEFNNKIFIESIEKEYVNKFDSQDIFSNKSLKNHVLKNLVLFISFLNEYKI